MFTKEGIFETAKSFQSLGNVSFIVIFMKNFIETGNKLCLDIGIFILVFNYLISLILFKITRSLK